MTVLVSHQAVPQHFETKLRPRLYDLTELFKKKSTKRRLGERYTHTTYKWRVKYAEKHAKLNYHPMGVGSGKGHATLREELRIRKIKLLAQN